MPLALISLAPLLMMPVEDTYLPGHTLRVGAFVDVSSVRKVITAAVERVTTSKRGAWARLEHDGGDEDWRGVGRR